MKQYIKPATKVRELAFTVPVFLNLSGGGEGELDHDFSHGRRGTWGNLWYDGDNEEESQTGRRHY